MEDLRTRDEADYCKRIENLLGLTPLMKTEFAQRTYLAQVREWVDELPEANQKRTFNRILNDIAKGYEVI